MCNFFEECVEDGDHTGKHRTADGAESVFAPGTCDLSKGCVLKPDHDGHHRDRHGQFYVLFGEDESGKPTTLTIEKPEK